jgi:transposase
LAGLWQEWQHVDEQVAAAERRIAAHFRSTAACQQIAKVEGIGPITASAVVALVGDAHHFRSGRQMAAWVGVTPKEHSSGETRRLSGLPNGGMRTCAPCWSTAPGPRYVRPSARTMRAAVGFELWCSGVVRTRRWWPWPIRTHAFCGHC